MLPKKVEGLPTLINSTKGYYEEGKSAEAEAKEAFLAADISAHTAQKKIDDAECKLGCYDESVDVQTCLKHRC